MKIDNNLLDKLIIEAKSNNRLRVNYDLRTSEKDQSQRMLNVLEPGTVIPIHRHKYTSETLILVRGKIRELFYDNEGKLIETIEMKVNGLCPILQIEKGQWHSLECLESGTIIFEAKDGAYTPLCQDDILIK